MWFRNLQLFRLDTPFELDQTTLAGHLQERRFRACGPLEQVSFGWTAPAGQRADHLVHGVNGCLLVAARRDEKLLPASFVSELVAERVAELEDRWGRQLGHRERRRIRDELLHELLPRALCRTQRTFACLVPRARWLVVDASSRRRAEEVCELLRSTLSSLPLSPAETTEAPSAVMTRWLRHGELPPGLQLEDECELRSATAEGNVVRCRRQDLAAAEVGSHLAAGKEAVQLALTWQDRVSFVLDQHLAVRRVRFLDIVREQAAEVKTADDLERFDADMAVMTVELFALLTALPQWFGGMRPAAAMPNAAARRDDDQAAALVAAFDARRA